MSRVPLRTVPGGPDFIQETFRPDPGPRQRRIRRQERWREQERRNQAVVFGLFLWSVCLAMATLWLVLEMDRAQVRQERPRIGTTRPSGGL